MVLLLATLWEVNHIVSILSLADVEVNLEQTQYTVREGSPGLEVCVTATGRQRNRTAVYICTEGDTALGTMILYS